jgi:7-carboxy-7-deazaguanine synthase
MYAVDPDEVAKLPKFTAQEILHQVLDLGEAAWVTLSGGNPLLFNLGYLVHLLRYAGFKVAVETQGTIYKEWASMCEVVTVSPKPPSAGNITPDHLVEKFIRQTERYHGRARINLKIVVFDEQDYQYARDMFMLFPDYERWIQVGNSDVSPNTTPLDEAYHKLGLLDKMRWMCERIMEDPDPVMQNVRVTPQLHTLMWGNARAT